MFSVINQGARRICSTEKMSLLIRTFSSVHNVRRFSEKATKKRGLSAKQKTSKYNSKEMRQNIFFYAWAASMFGIGAKAIDGVLSGKIKLKPSDIIDCHY